MNVIDQSLLKQYGWTLESSRDGFLFRLRGGDHVALREVGRGSLKCRLKLPTKMISAFNREIATTALISAGEFLIDLNKFDRILQFLDKYDAPRKEEENLRKLKEKLKSISRTEVDEILSGRIGQNVLRDYLLLKYKKCVVTGIDIPELLVASHIKPWSECSDDEVERLDENNVLLLSVAIDKLFDRYFISFDAVDGHMLVSSKIDIQTLYKLGVNPATMSIPKPSSEQAAYLRYHNARLKRWGANECDA